MKKKRGLSILVLLVLLLTITIGYSVLSTTLNISGSTTIGSSSWDIHFANVSVTHSTTGSTAPVIATTGQNAGLSISYAPKLNVPGDYYEFTVDVVNAGSMDAVLDSFTLGGYADIDAFANYTVTYSDGTAIATGNTLNHGQTRKIKVRVEYDDTNPSVLPTQNQSTTLTCVMKYNQA